MTYPLGIARIVTVKQTCLVWFTPIAPERITYITEPKYLSICEVSYALMEKIIEYSIQ